MSQQEMLDILNEEKIKIGTDTRANAHAQGLWHQTFHCWIVNHSTSGGSSLLFQLRHKDKDTYPGLLDVSCAGHLLAGESVRDGVRELNEELGLTIPFDELIPCGMVAEVQVISEHCIDREFNNIFFHESDKPLEEYSFQTSEISGLFYINLREFQSLYHGSIDHLWTEGIVTEDESENILHVKRRLQIQDFTPMTNEYARVLFEKLNM